MFIKNIKITNFKSLYGTHEFNFEDLTGLIKLSGSIGAGKTSVGEAILYLLFGNVKGQTNTGIVSWCTKGETIVEGNIKSKDKEIHIVRSVNAPLEVEINGRTLAASNKRNAQDILEEEYYDVPRLVIERMCIISFNQFKSLALMSPGDTKMFLDEVFGFNTFTEYNNVIIEERKEKLVEQTKLQASYDESCSNIEYFKTQREIKQQELANQINIDDVTKKIDDISLKMQSIIDDVNQSKLVKDDKEKNSKDEINKLTDEINEYNIKINEYKVLGKQEKDWINKFQNGYCPTCGNKIDQSLIEEHKIKMNDYANKIYEMNSNISCINLKKSEISGTIQIIENEFNSYRAKRLQEYNDLKVLQTSYNTEIIKYNESLKVINQNYDQMISDYESKRDETKKLLDASYVEIGEWNEMNELFSKTLRYSLLNQLIPQINNSIQTFINKFELSYNVEFDQEFKSHIFAYGIPNEISYSNLSTGQKKTLDIAIILGILQNIISTVDFNILFCDELFSNMDVNSRNIMLQVLNESNVNGRTIFVINHSEMPDDAFNHKIRVELNTHKIEDKKKNTYIVKTSKYEKIF